MTFLTTNDTPPADVTEAVPDPDDALVTDEVPASEGVAEPVISEDDALTSDAVPPTDWTGEPADTINPQKAKAKAPAKAEADDEPAPNHSKGATKK
jgi:hypothetical protein